MFVCMYVCYKLEEEIRRQVDSYRSVDRSGPVWGPVHNRSSNRSPLNPSYTGEESREQEGNPNQKHYQLEEAVQRQVDF